MCTELDGDPEGTAARLPEDAEGLERGAFVGLDSEVSSPVLQPAISVDVTRMAVTMVAACPARLLVIGSAPV
ncbi:hypothetical protein SNL152K_1113 [Streptomyces sp. NL15-2K]|nr:hypothetical protein SNL152K_1113 [Streptomyces sp. NL15-2K]